MTTPTDPSLSRFIRLCAERDAAARRYLDIANSNHATSAQVAAARAILVSLDEQLQAFGSDPFKAEAS